MHIFAAEATAPASCRKHH